MMLLVSGTRWATIADHGITVRDTILAAVEGDGPHEIHVGDARGVDFIVRQAFRRRPGFTVVEYEARWDECAADCPATGHRRKRAYSRDTCCPGAGMRRNRAMIAAFVDLGGKTMLAFPAANTKSAGTRGCIRDARKAGLVVPDDRIVPLTVVRHARP
jgi:hypothetical protein